MTPQLSGIPMNQCEFYIWGAIIFWSDCTLIQFLLKHQFENHSKCEQSILLNCTANPVTGFRQVSNWINHIANMINMWYASYFQAFLLSMAILSWWTGRDSQNYTYWHGIKGINETGCACDSDDSCIRWNFIFKHKTISLTRVQYWVQCCLQLRWWTNRIDRR